MSQRNSKPLPIAELLSEDSVRESTSPTSPKLRLSCDWCTQSKVKCDKTKPACHRCQAHDLQCVYGLSLRTGKRSPALSSATTGRKSKTRCRNRRARTNKYNRNDDGSVSHNREETRTNETRNGLSPAPTEDPIIPESGLDFLPSFLYDHDASVFLDSHQRPEDMLTDFSQGLPSVPKQMDQQQRSPPDIDLIALNPSNAYQQSTKPFPSAMSPASTALQRSQVWREHSNAHSNVNSSNFVSSHNHSSFQSSMSAENPYFPIQTSVNTANNPATLQSPPTSTPDSIRTFHHQRPKRDSCHCLTFLIAAPQKLFRISNPDTVSFDVALAANKDAATRCLQAIECGCWTHDHANGMTISSIIARIISVYWDRARGMIPQFSTVAPPSPENGPTMAGTSDTWMMGFYQDMEEESKGPGFSLGAYTLDKEDEAMLKVEIVLIELKKMRRLIQSFQQGFSPQVDFWRTLCVFLTGMIQDATLDLKSSLSMAEE